MKMLLRRHYLPMATFGELWDDQGTRVAVTVECPWLNNQPNISCIPEGRYQLTGYTSPHKGHCLALNAPELGVQLTGPALRTACLMHSANRASELQGCIAPGDSFGVVASEWAVMNSRQTMQALLNRINNQPCTLTIMRD